MLTIMTGIGLVSLMTNDVIFKRGDGKVLPGEDSVRAFISKVNDIHMDARGWESSGDTLMWHSTMTSQTFGRMGVNPVGNDDMAVFSGDKIRYFATDLDERTENKLALANFYKEIVNGGHIDSMEKYIAPDYVERH